MQRVTIALDVVVPDGISEEQILAWARNRMDMGAAEIQRSNPLRRTALVPLEGSVRITGVLHWRRFGTLPDHDLGRRVDWLKRPEPEAVVGPMNESIREDFMPVMCSRCGREMFNWSEVGHANTDVDPGVMHGPLGVEEQPPAVFLCVDCADEFDAKMEAEE